MLSYISSDIYIGLDVNVSTNIGLRMGAKQQPVFST